MQRIITNEINKLTSIKLRKKDFLGKGAQAEVYSYKIQNR